MDKNHSNSPSSQRKQDANTPLKSDDINIQYGGISTKDDDDVSLIDSGSEGKSKFMKIYEFVITLTIEPVIFCFMFAFVMNLSIMPNMMMDKGCLYYYNFSKEICDNISYYDAEKEKVETLATNYSLYANLTSFIAAFMMAFVAPWSDKYGRKIPLLVSVFCAILTDIGVILCAKYFESPLVYLVISRLPSEFAGGFICMLTIIFSHASEVSSEKNRTLKYTSVEIAMGFGIGLGGLAGGFVYRYYGYFTVYVTVAAMHLFCFLWILWIVEETTGLGVNMKWHEKARDFFTCDSFKAGVVVTCKSREGNTRKLLLLLMASMCMIVLNYEAFSTIAYVYVHHVYNWDPETYSIVNTTGWFFGILSTSIIVPILVKFFKFRDFTLGVIGTLSMIGKNLLFAVSKYHTYLFYIGTALGIFSSLSSLAVRTCISKLVEREELGRVFSFLATCEAVIPMLGNIAVTQVFNVTMDIFPSVTYTVGVSVLVLPFGVFIWALKSTENPYSGLNVPISSDSKEKV